MRQEGLVPSLLVFGVLPSFLGPSSSNKNQLERFNALQLARAEMKSIVAENRIKISLRSKLPHATRYLIRPGQEVRVYRENKNKWEGPCEVTEVVDKVIYVTDDIKLKQVNKSAVLPMPPKINDPELKDEIKKMTRFVTNTQDLQLPTKSYKIRPQV